MYFNFPHDIFISNNLDLYFKHKITGKKWGCIRTDILRNRPFKEINGSFLPENWIWFHIARKYKVLCVNEALRNYYTVDEDCLTKPKPKDLLRSAESHYTSIVWNLNSNFDYISKYESLINIAKQFVSLWRFAFLNDIAIINVVNDFSDKKLKILSFLFLVPSLLIYRLTFG